MRYPFDWVDAFTTQPFAGNGCVVVHGADEISINDRLALVSETSLSECAFIVASDAADFGARYYVEGHEILMAGHPTIATVTSLIDRGLVDMSTGSAAFTLEVGAGILPIEVETGPRGPRITMTQQAPIFGPVCDAKEVAAIYGLCADDIAHPPQIVSTGTSYCVTLLKDKDALRRAELDPDALHAFRAASGLPDANTMEPFLVTLGGATTAGDTFSRLLLPPPMPPEDPFTGSATGTMAAYLWHHGLIGNPDFIAEQGHWIGRPGQAQVRVLGPRDTPTGVNVGGEGYVLMRGELSL